MAGITAQEAPTVPPRAASVSRRAIAIAAAATVLNTALWGAGRLLGVDFVVVPRGSAPADAQAISAGIVAAVTIMSVLLGAVLLAATRRASERWWPRVASTGLAIGLVTLAMPLVATASVGTKGFLATMHLLTGVIWFVQVRRAVTGGSN
ncbi:MAG TPA: DUF6069 family protein [Intrasporangium sp.]|nr:DUF6069 family protein [Intrasporangium sp.]